MAEAPNSRKPDSEVAQLLEAVASFQNDDYVMTEAEARALSDTSPRNRSRIEPRLLPIRCRQAQVADGAPGACE